MTAGQAPVPSWTPFALALGGNQGDPVAAMADAVERLSATQGVRVTGLSGLYVTAPVGGVAQPDFYNAVVVGSTRLDAAALLALAQGLEDAHGRTREVRWGPRTLDIDVVAYGDARSDDPALTLPHPRAHERAFVLVPWVDADPAAVLPGHGLVAQLAAASEVGGIRLIADRGWDRLREPAAASAVEGESR